MSEQEDGRSPRRAQAISAIIIAELITTLTGTIANIALPTIARELDVSPAASVWVVNAYQTAVVISLLSAAALGDIFGYRRIFKIGLTLYTLGSLGCALSSSLPMLIGARFLQGFGGAGILSCDFALLRFLYTRETLGRGVGLVSLTVAATSAAGPSVAAALLTVAAWPWLFGLSVPFGIAALILAMRSLPASPSSGQRFDGGSGFLGALTFGALLAALGNLGGHQPLLLTVAEFSMALVAGFFLVRRQAGRPAPLLPVDFFRRPAFSLSAATAVFTFSAQWLGIVALPFYFQDVLGHTQGETGLLMTPWPLAVVVTAPIAGRLADRHSAAVLCGIGCAVLSLGFLGLTLLPANPSALAIGLCMIVSGAGFGFFQSPNNRAIISSAPRERSGGAGGVLAISRLFGQTLGASLASSVFSIAGSHAAAQSAGAIGAVALAACLALLASGLSFLRLIDRGSVENAAE